ncbi:MAG: DNA repair protein RadA [Neisseriales bacterium]|nr:MAG: DNA repair protein RadA [Neisseriales bacterium]
MVKQKIVYMCQECGVDSPKWQGQCPHCQAWNSLKEHRVQLDHNHVSNWSSQQSTVHRLSDIRSEALPRFLTTVHELDHVLGGGFVLGAVVLLGGDPGIGKSTLLLQALAAMSVQHKTLYISGEESVQQIALRADRLGLTASNMHLLTETHLETMLAILQQEKPEVVVVDSIQTMVSDRANSAPGSVTQVRECALQLTQFAKAHRVTIFLVGHVTKEGAIAGPRVLEHIVDTVLYFEGDNHSRFRLVRAIKNRFGAVNALGVFAMTDTGLRSVQNPSKFFLSAYSEVPGSCVLVTQEGTRPLLVEIQALVNASYGFQPKRLSVGLESTRLAMLLAVLQRHAGMALYDHDVFLNAVGGVKITEPAADLATILAIVSSYKNYILPARTVVFGEVGLSGEVRAVMRGQERLKEAVKLGFSAAIIPASNAPRSAIKGLTVTPVKRLADAVAYVTAQV